MRTTWFALVTATGLAACGNDKMTAPPPPLTMQSPAATPLARSPGINAAADLDQCANGPMGAPVPCAGGAWTNQNLNANHSHYLEGQSVPYRLALSDLAVGAQHVVRLQWDALEGDDHAIDYLTSFDRTEASADPCAGVAG